MSLETVELIGEIVRWFSAIASVAAIAMVAAGLVALWLDM